MKDNFLESLINLIKRNLFNRTFIHIFFIAVIVIIIYSNTFNAKFQFDDITNIVDNFRLRDIKNFWPPVGVRWFGYLTFALNYRYGGLDVVGYHVVNLAIHILNGLLIYLLVILTLKTPFLRSWRSRCAFPDDTGYSVAMFSALLFIAHPVQTQAVTYIIQRFASLATLFYLISLVMYIKGRLYSQRVESRGSTYILYYSISVLSAIIATNTKEIAFTLPFIIGLYEACFFSKSSDSSSKDRELKRLYFIIPLLIALLAISVTMIYPNRTVENIINNFKSLSLETEDIPRGIYILTQFGVIVTYIRLLFLPINQNLDYDYPMSFSFFESGTFFSFLFLLFLFCFALYLFIRSRKTGNGYSLLVSFGMFWFFITLLPESSLIPIRDVIYEHRLYLPSVGVAIAFSSIVFYIIGYIKERFGIKVSFLRTACIVLLLTVIPLGIATYKRNMVWKDGITLWEDVVEKSPNKARGHNNLGKAYYEKGWLSIAMEQYHFALILKPDYADAHNNLGVAFRDKGFTDKAMEHYDLAISLKPNFAEAHNNLGIAYASNGLIDKAIEYFHLALSQKPNFADAYNNLGAAFKSKGLTDKAIEHYNHALRLKPDLVKAHINLGLIYVEKGRIDDARREFGIALKIDPDNYHARKFLDLISNIIKK